MKKLRLTKIKVAKLNYSETQQIIGGGTGVVCETHSVRTPCTTVKETKVDCPTEWVCPDDFEHVG